MVGENPEGETFGVPTTKIERICVHDAAALSKMAEPFDESSWTIWCEKMHRIFKVVGALPYIDGTIPCLDKETDPEEWKTWDFNNDFAQCLITSNFNAKQMIHIGQAKTAYETWQNLASIYIPKGYQNATAVSRNYHDTHVKEAGDVVKHLDKLKGLWE